MGKVGKLLNQALAPFGVQMAKKSTNKHTYPFDFTKDDIDIFEKVKNFTMVSRERIKATINAIEYIYKCGIEGEIVECGVWKGGCSMAMALALIKGKETNRKLYLFDTFNGMVEPTEKDVDYGGGSAKEVFKINNGTKDGSNWCRSTKGEVLHNIRSTGYPEENLILIEGKVEDTIPKITPKKIALLRLDTDWYESTKHELLYLYPLLTKGGILIIDDYGYWKGAKQAVDEYIEENGLSLHLSRTDETGRVAVKP